MSSKFNSLGWMFWGGLVGGSIAWLVLVGVISFLYELFDHGWWKTPLGWLFIIAVLGYFFWTFLFSVLTIRATFEYKGNRFYKYGTWIIIGIYTVAVMAAWAFLTHVTTMSLHH